MANCQGRASFSSKDHFFGTSVSTKEGKGTWEVAVVGLRKLNIAHTTAANDLYGTLPNSLQRAIKLSRKSEAFSWLTALLIYRTWLYPS